MAYGSNLPTIGVPGEIGRAFGTHKGESCLVVLKVKYRSEKDWLYQRLWMVPGWEQTDIWQKAYKWLKNDAKLLYYDLAEIEEVRFHSFKLV